MLDLEGRIQFWNGWAERISGYLRQEVIGRPCSDNLLTHCDAQNNLLLMLRLAGVPHIGHTEMLETYLDSPNPLTLFITENMRIFFLSRHYSLRQAIDYIKEHAGKA